MDINDRLKRLEIYGVLFLIWMFTIVFVPKDNAIIDFIWIVIFFGLFINIFVQFHKLDKDAEKDNKFKKILEKRMKKGMWDYIKISLVYLILFILFIAIKVFLNTYLNVEDSLSYVIAIIPIAIIWFICLKIIRQ